IPQANGGGFAGVDPRPLLKDLAASLASDFTANLEAMPEDRRTWQPFPGVRTAVDQAGESVQAFGWIVSALENRSMAGFQEEEPEIRTAVRREIAANIGDEMRRGVAAWEQAMDAVPADELDAMIPMFFPGWEESLQSNMIYAVWNARYHLGQIQYIQTLYGDLDPHMPPAE
ncbi:MAG: DinB family protein, partial [Fimbriimonadaceae bacterium]|nr:DinB family protein [Fimbriimonadaceae bacterium]